VADVTNRLKEIFDEAFMKAPAVICLDDIDYLCRNMATNQDEPAHDAGKVIKNEQICDCLEELLHVTERNNELGSLSAETMYNACSYRLQHPAGVADSPGSTDIDTHVRPIFTLSEDTRTHGSLAYTYAYAPHRVLAQCLGKAVYVLASAKSSQTLHPRLTDLLSLGRHIVVLPTCLPPPARVSILRSALDKLGWPLLLEGGSPSQHGCSCLQHQQLRRDEGALEKLTEGYQPPDLWALARNIVAARVYASHGRAEAGTAWHQSSLPDVARACDSYVPRSERGMQMIQAPDKASSWRDVGGYSPVKQSLFDTFRRPMLFRKLYVRNKIKFPRGVMLFGPPGTGKTALARATGGELGLPLIAVRGPELLNKYIGESERAVRSLFDKVREWYTVL
jgi:SpoVK/Ycf46/Vps4 family AAA+-type ATPase